MRSDISHRTHFLQSWKVSRHLSALGHLTLVLFRAEPEKGPADELCAVPARAVCHHDGVVANESHCLSRKPLLRFYVGAVMQPMIDIAYAARNRHAAEHSERQTVQQTAWQRQTVQQTAWQRQTVQQTAWQRQTVQQTAWQRQTVQQTAWQRQTVQQTAEKYEVAIYSNGTTQYSVVTRARARQFAQGGSSRLEGLGLVTNALHSLQPNE